MKTEIQNIFTPALAIWDPTRFAGRQDQLDTVAQALQSAGTQIVIYGNRGVGKSSLARQLEGLARGDATVIDRLTLKPSKTPDYLVISIECDDTVDSIKTLILRLLTDDGALAGWLPWRVEKKVVTGDAGAALTVKVVKLSGKVASSETLIQDSLESDVFAVFGNAIGHILDSGAVDGILFVIDEVDRIKERSELASIIRSRGADSRVKFALVGVGTTPSELILDHESIARQISDGCVEMPPMSVSELQEIFDGADEMLQEHGISFTPAARDWIISIARGHPYYVHLMGKHCVLRAAISGDLVISEEIAKDVLAEIANKGTAKIQEALYLKAIGHSYLREFILKAFADAPSDEIQTSSVYPLIATARGIDASAVSVYVGHLVSAGALEKTRERHYRFKDSLFKAYAAARPFQHRTDKVEAD